MRNRCIRSLVAGLVLLHLSFSFPAEAQDQRYVGRSLCAQCHRDQDAAWQGSHHDLAMQDATPETVLGDFDNAEFEVFGVKSRFFRSDGRYMVRTDGPDGQLADYPVKYTFGAYPLQQYLIEFPGGRLQVLDIGWDTRPKEAGGQRWFHLHPEDPVRHDDVLHWTGPNLNWNYMCGDCHTTDLKKNYDAASDRYHTTWSEIDVSCEACHGPGSGHVAWAEARQRGESPEGKNKGLTVLFDERKGIAWNPDEATGKPRRSTPRKTEKEIQACARCHSRRSQFDDDFVPGDTFLDSFRPALLREGLYFADGQIEDEVYVWGSFLQSKMYQAGLTCSDCHDPHAADIRVPGDGVCHECHAVSVYADENHHFHEPGSAGASCVACHMPPRTYMQVDARHDHSFRVPRPDLSVSVGTPNACNVCHSDRTPHWAADRVREWLGRQPRGLQGYAGALHAARQGLPGAGDMLRSLAADAMQPGIARATALSSLGGYPSRDTLILVQTGLNSDQPLERLGALDALGAMGPQQLALAFSLLWDDVRAVRIAAARLLAGLPSRGVPEQVRGKLDEVIQEYLEVQQFAAERPESQLNLAGLYADRGRYDDAEQAYRTALRLQPRFVPAFVNFAQLLAARNREPEAEQLLRTGLERNPDNADLEHALGLSLVRQHHPEDGLEYLARAAKHAPDIARYSYVHAVALHSSGRVDEAIGALETAHERHPGNVDILYALVTFNRDAGHRFAAARHASRLLELQPGNPAVEQLVRELGGE